MAARDEDATSGQSGGNNSPATNRRVTNGNQVIVARDYDGVAAIIAVEPDADSDVDVEEVVADLREDAERIVDDDLAAVNVDGGGGS